MAEQTISPAGDDPLAPGAQLGRFSLVRPIGEGGMGVVYQAYDPELQRTVAVKVLRRRDGHDGQLRLVREAQALAQLAHPNVVAVHDVGVTDGRVFIAMEYVEALRGIGEAQLPAGDAAAALVTLAQAIALDTPATREEAGRARFQYARALWAHGEREQARAVARRPSIKPRTTRITLIRWLFPPPTQPVESSRSRSWLRHCSDSSPGEVP